MDAVAALAQPEAVVGSLRRALMLCRPRRIVGPRPAMRPIQHVPQRRIGPFPAGRRDVQRLSGGKLHARRHEMQLHAPALGVLMANPRDVVLLGVHAREGQTLECVHRLALLVLGRRVLQGKRQDAVGVAPLAVDAVDQLTGPVHVTAHHLRRRMIAPCAIGAGEVGGNFAAAAAASGGELNQHRRAVRAPRARRQARGRSRSAAAGAPQPARAGDGSRHGQAD